MASQEESNSDTEYDDSQSSDPFDFDDKFNTFDDVIKYNIDWINNKIKNNVLSETFGYANDGEYDMEPVRFNKELMIKLNNLGFLTTCSQGGCIKSTDEYEIKERAYVDGYIKTDIAKNLRNIMNWNNKYFQYVPISKVESYKDRNVGNLLHYARIPVTLEIDKETGKFGQETHLGMTLNVPLLKSSSCDLYHKLWNDYSYCYAWDPLFGIPFDDKENGLMTMLCSYLEQSNK
jgi:hypothetical protein